MKPILQLILPCLALLLGIYTCEQEKSSTGLPYGSLDQISECKEFKSTAVWEGTADSLSCIEYSYDAENSQLLLKHVNAGFNCCPGKIYGDVRFVNDTIIIKESEKDGMCDCLCLYDLEFKLTGISEKVYAVRLNELYAGDQEKFTISIDLAVNTSGSFCIVRKEYPWGLHN